MIDLRFLLVLAGAAGAASLQGRLGESNAERRANDFRYTPDPRVIRVVAGAHRSTVADVLWLRTLPDMARPFNDREMKKRWIGGATDVITDLEPTFGTVYSFGAAHLNIVDKNPEAAIALLQKGIAMNPDSAGLYIALAMVYFEYKHDRDKTMEYLDVASRLPGVDTLSLAMLAAMRVEGRDDLVALYYWSKALEDAPNRKIRVFTEYDLWRTKGLIAGRASREFKELHGRSPASPEELRDPKLMDPRVFDLVLGGLALDAEGRPHYARMDEVELERLVYLAEDYVAGFREGEGRIPNAAEFATGFGALPPAPPGQKWVYAQGKLSLVVTK